MRKSLVSLITASAISCGVSAQDVDKKQDFADLSAAKPYVMLCEGNGCDAFMPAVNTKKYKDYAAQQKWGSALGGLSGALIGEEVAGAPGAIVLGILGASAGYSYTDSKKWEEDVKAYDAAWQRGDDIFYNPVHRLPLEAHWMYAGPTPTPVD